MIGRHTEPLSLSESEKTEIKEWTCYPDQGWSDVTILLIHPIKPLCEPSHGRCTIHERFTNDLFIHNNDSNPLHPHPWSNIRRVDLPRVEHLHYPQVSTKKERLLPTLKCPAQSQLINETCRLKESFITVVD